MQLFHRFPCVVAFRVSLPFQEVLELFVLPKASVLPYCFNFVLVFPFDKVRWWPREVGTMWICFNIWGKKTSMKHGMDVPLGWEFQVVGDGRYDFCNFEWTVAPRGEFYCPI